MSFFKEDKYILEYLGGSPLMTSKTLAVYRLKDGLNGVVMVYPADGEVEYIQIMNIIWQEQTSRSLGKAAAGAVIGGVLTGGIGLIAGAALGARKKDQSMAIIESEYSGRNHQFYVRCNQQQFKDISSWIKY